jgi:hypothetical protein
MIPFTTSSLPESTRNPTLYQVNTRTCLDAIGQRLGRHATLDDLTGSLDGIVPAGTDLLYLLGVWRTGAAGREVSRGNQVWREEFARVLPDLREEDICGSCFAITGYQVPDELGGDPALERLRARLHAQGIRLILDFVPNHTAPDHPWSREHPAFYVRGTEEDLAREPQNYLRNPEGDILAYGRDPYFDGWPDTLQLNYGNPDVQAAMLAELGAVAGRCDGVRCDMAMLVLPDVFERTWGIPAQPFWPKATARIKAERPDFIFMAEVYWDLEWELQRQGFDFTYDKRLYDRLVEGDAGAVKGHLRADLDFQGRSARFLENHDEPRAAFVFPPDRHRAAAVATFFCPGLRFFHQGQLEGARLRLPVHLCRAPVEPIDQELARFYRSLLDCLCRPVTRRGEWSLLECRPAWEGNWTHDSFVVYAWHSGENERLVIAVNYGEHQSQCYVPLPFADLPGRDWLFRDLLNEISYERTGDALGEPGLYLDMPPWGYHLFEMAPVGSSDTTDRATERETEGAGERQPVAAGGRP